MHIEFVNCDLAPRISVFKYQILYTAMLWDEYILSQTPLQFRIALGRQTPVIFSHLAKLTAPQLPFKPIQIGGWCLIFCIPGLSNLPLTPFFTSKPTVSSRGTIYSKNHLSFTITQHHDVLPPRRNRCIQHLRDSHFLLGNGCMYVALRLLFLRAISELLTIHIASPPGLNNAIAAIYLLSRDSSCIAYIHRHQGC